MFFQKKSKFLNDQKGDHKGCGQALSVFSVILFFVSAVMAPERAVARSKGNSAFGLLPLVGYSTYSGKAVENMNKRLGNSPRVSQQKAFGTSLTYGAQAGYWNSSQRLFFGGTYLQTAKTLTGNSAFNDVSAEASLSLEMQLLQFGLRVGPIKSKFNPKKPRSVLERIKITTFLLGGSSALSLRNQISDPASSIDVDYSYSSTLLTWGGQLTLAYAYNHWFHFILFDGRALLLNPLGSKVSVKSFEVSGRDESAFAPTVLEKELAAEILMYQFFAGIEVTF